MAVAARLEPVAMEHDRRAGDRYVLRLEAAGTPDQSAGAALVHNLSQGGMLMESSADLGLGSKLQVCLEGATITEATIVWKRDNYFGCQFDNPISKSTLAAALLKSQAGLDWQSADDLLGQPPRAARLWAIFLLSAAAWGAVVLLAASLT